MKLLPLFALLLVLTACGGGTDETVTEAPVRAIRAAPVVFDDGSSSLVFSGVAEAAGRTPLSFRVGGTVRQLPVALGQRVSRGQLIATLDPADLVVQRSQATAQRQASQAQLESAETQLIAAQAAYERTAKLYESNSVSLSQFEQARSQYQTSRAQVEAARSQLEASGAQVNAASNQVAYTRLTAPFAGVITEKHVEANEFAPSGTAIVTLSTDHDPEVKVNVPEDVIGRLSAGQSVEVSFSSIPDRHFPGTVSEVAYAAAGSPSYPITITVADEDEAIRPGMAANVRFSFTTEGSAGDSLLLAPIASVAEGPDGKFVFRLEPTDSADQYIARRTPVTIGKYYARGFVVREGLDPDDLVATAGLKQLLDGMRVRLLPQ
ncbi:efflux RND transporter periplasmic adaptor subunit [Lewinella sp. JB7]|uniref:efflux RND transporter periplasmic adaptor subunit n=1 Tax=Lewinella sp. JB7 TaxID=2962887 RepID=UPI0020C979DD|nr:efflux RND transporter periplasmic adaptor subunit [Lewinella sp. JB7]MCP9234699.1 efflux RND transporter periplasmic adaptor subunit [Lewinella sp. JB7]